MIIVKLMGGLGNQMFQYATARHIALKNKTSIGLDLSLYEHDPLRKYELNCFKLSSNVRLAEPPSSFYDFSSATTRKAKLKHHIKRLGRAPERVLEKGFSFEHNSLIGDTARTVGLFDPSILHTGGNAYLVGFWQNEKYFRDSRNTILNDFSFKEEPTGKNKQLLKIVENTNAISLHIRRSDYVNNKHTAAIHGVVEMAYYKKAVGLLAARIKDPHFFVISDDPEWCSQNLTIKYPVTYVSHNRDKGHEDMRLMSRCKHHIIANSSFSWWGAWLNQDSDKIVYAPKKWMNDASINTEDIVPEAWIKL